MKITLFRVTAGEWGRRQQFGKKHELKLIKMKTAMTSVLHTVLKSRSMAIKGTQPF